MTDGDRFNFLSAAFDPSALLEESENVPFDPVCDQFYSKLLGGLSDQVGARTLLREPWQTLASSIERLRNSRLSVGRLSHAFFLLPWTAQPASAFKDSTTAGEGSGAPAPAAGRNQLKASAYPAFRSPAHIPTGLKQFVARSKSEAETAKQLLELRLTGYTHTRNASYEFLRQACASGREVAVLTRPSGNSPAVRYRGTVIFFDRDSNLLLGSVTAGGRQRSPFVYIRYVRRMRRNCAPAARA
ncbi:LacI family transcriptional regulator [Babesia caballi]|uniref:LacI family transcriptional regulator n=1 Tax=Babesia caballi TaxID=5871 RepID=A0AAV4LLS5_BABCB|nr:LacI family transcriptional regulator [Babesia caballi]